MKQARRLDSLTSLRLLAALIVVCHHARGTLLPLWLTFPANEAVGFFFVLSGFILTYTYYGRTFSTRKFYVARLARILPASLLSLVVFTTLINPSILGAIHSGSSRELTIAASSILLVQAWIPIPAYFFGLNSVLWSVSTEAFFYLFFPALHRGLGSRAGRFCLLIAPVAIFLLMLSLVAWNQLPSTSATSYNSVTLEGMLYIHPLSRLKDFCLGMLAAVIYIRWQSHSPQPIYNKQLLTCLEVFSLLLLLAGIQAVGGELYQHLPHLAGYFAYHLLAALMCAAIIFLFAIQGGMLSRALRSRFLVIGGEISFSIYLFHQMINTWQSSHPETFNWAPIQYRFLVYTGTTIALSYGIWRWFECPMRDWIRKGLG